MQILIKTDLTLKKPYVDAKDRVKLFRLCAGELKVINRFESVYGIKHYLGAVRPAGR